LGEILPWCALVVHRLCPGAAVGWRPEPPAGAGGGFRDTAAQVEVTGRERGECTTVRLEHLQGTREMERERVGHKRCRVYTEAPCFRPDLRQSTNLWSDPPRRVTKVVPPPLFLLGPGCPKYEGDEWSASAAAPPLRLPPAPDLLYLRSGRISRHVIQRIMIPRFLS
jgi:hypothetical protein